MLSSLSKKYNSTNIGLIRDNGVTVFWDISGDKVETIVDYLEIALNLINSTYHPLHEFDGEKFYINVVFGHPPPHPLQIIKIDWKILYPMDTSLSTRHRFDIKIPRWKSVDISPIMKGESNWKEWHLFDMDNSTLIRLSKSVKCWWVLHMFFSMSFRCRINVTSKLAAWCNIGSCYHFVSVFFILFIYLTLLK